MTSGVLSLLAIVSLLILLLMTFLRFNQEKMIFFPETLPQDYRFKFDYPFEEVFLDAPDGARLNALHFTTGMQDRPKGVVLFFHGNAGSLRSWGQIAEDFVERGYNLFLPDYRTFGKSTGTISEEALHADARLAYSYLLERYPEQEVVVFGRSVGSGIAIKLASENNPRLLVLETPYYNFSDLAKQHYPFLPVDLLLSYTFRSDQWIGQVKCPIYLLHGTEDTIIPHESSHRLAGKAQVPAEVISIPGGGHNDLALYPQYQQALDRILLSQ